MKKTRSVCVTKNKRGECFKKVEMVSCVQYQSEIEKWPLALVRWQSLVVLTDVGRVGV